MIFSDIVDMFFPRRCVFCQKFLKKHETDICENCLRHLPYTAEGYKRKGEFFSACIAPLYYKDNVRKAIIRFKFRGKTNYARPFGRLMAECIKMNFKGEYDLIGWVPLSKKRYKERGYSQAALLAMAAALELEDIAAELLMKTKETPAQSTLGDKGERKANVSGVYTLKDPELIIDKRILLIDDIVTTGATLSECARVLLSGGADSVICCALSSAD